ncbi:MAG: M23 family metallopeptidase [Clostridia bacterium]|nr:M23 family metallopeptidase [Clostridia bacterium]
MKKPQTPIYLALAISVFLLSFFIGRATALKSSEEAKKDAIYTGRMILPQKENEDIPTGNISENIEALDAFSMKSAEKEETEKKPEKEKLEEVEIEEEMPPEKMLFPCGQDVLKGYSQTAVYSKTMDDWRAHTGIDYKAKEGDGVVSAWDGTVLKVYKDSYWGYCVEILHPGKIVSVYRNLDKNISVKEGEEVKKGQAIAFVGSSAVIERREEPHLHFELWVDGITINPESYIY